MYDLNNARAPTVAALTMTLVACVFDVSPTPRDAGGPPSEDVGQTGDDDAGMTIVDVGTIAEDTGALADDTGTPNVDDAGTPIVDAGIEGPFPPNTPFVCPSAGFYFCDDFGDGTLAKWDTLIDTHGLPEPGVFDVLQGPDSNHMRFIAGTRGDALREGELIVVNASAFSAVTTPDYAIEFRIRPRRNDNSAQRWIFPMGRYQGPLQWYYGGLNAQNSAGSSRLETGYANGDAIVEEANGGGPFTIGRRDETDGEWYIVRFDMVGNEFTTYFNGEEVASFTDDQNRYPNPGRIGFFTYNRSFEIDYVTVGDPARRPAQLTIDYDNLSWNPDTDDPDLDVTVTAVRSDGTPDTFTALTSDASIVSVTTTGNTVTLSPIDAGDATVAFYSGSKPLLRRVIQVSVNDD